MHRSHCIAAIFCLFLASCSHTQPRLEQVVIKCGEVAVREAASNIIPRVQAILAGEGDGWQAELSALVLEAGEAAVACAVREAMTAVPLPAQRSALLGSDVSVQVKQTRGKAWLGQRGCSFAD